LFSLGLGGNMNPGVKLTAGAVLVAAAIGYLAFLGAASSWQYYLSVDEAVADAVHLEGRRLRVSGRIAAGSLSIGDDRRQATFDIASERHALHVTCHCLLPDNLAEDIDVVVEGVFGVDGIHGDKVITRCASKYQPTDTTAVRDETPAAPAT
jgi:cytochrome c-type biogenesis protein CcmE